MAASASDGHPMGNVLTLTPPLMTTQAQMDQALDILREALETAIASGGGQAP